MYAPYARIPGGACRPCADPGGGRVRRRSHPPLPAADRGTAGAAPRRAAPFRSRRAPRFPDRDCRHPQTGLDRRAAARRSPRSARRDYRPGRPQDDHQRAQFRRLGVHGGLRRRQLANLGQRRRRPVQPDGRRTPDHLVPVGRRQTLLVEPEDRDAARSPARLPPARAPCRGGRQAGARHARRLRSLLLPQRGSAPRRRHRTVFLFAEDAEPSRSAALERGVPARAGRARRAAQHDQGDGVDRNIACRIRDGRDPLRAARAQRRIELRPLGLYLQLDQDAPQRSEFRHARSRAGDDGSAVPKAYAQLLIKTCHRRNVHAMGGMAAQIPIKDNPEENERALDKVRADKLREVREGHDGTWVAHPALVPIAMQVFNDGMPAPNQLDRRRDDVVADAAKLVEPPQGTRTDAGLRHNIRVGIQYLEAWLGGQGAVPIYNLMEDAATAEISRTQIWQWLKHRASLDDGTPVTRELVAKRVEEEYARVRQEVGAARFDRGHFPEARKLFEQVATSEDFEDFLTIPAYDVLVKSTPPRS